LSICRQAYGALSLASLQRHRSIADRLT